MPGWEIIDSGAAPTHGWEVLDTKPPPEGAFQHVREVASRGLSGVAGGVRDIVKGIGQLGSRFSDKSAGVDEAGVERTEQGGVMRHGKPIGLRLRPGVEDIAVGGLEAEGGAMQAITSPVTAANPAIERATGIPTSVTDVVAPMLAPFGGYAAGRAAARAVPETVAAKAPTLAELRAGTPTTGNVARRANEAAADKLATIDDIGYRAKLRHPGARDDFVQGEFRKILEDKAERAKFSDDEISQMEKIVRGTVPGNLARWIEEALGGTPVGQGVAALSGGKALGRLSTGRQVGKLEEGIARGTPEAARRPDEPNPVRAYIDTLFPPMGGFDWRKGGGGESGSGKVVSLAEAKADRAARGEVSDYDRVMMKQAILKYGGLPQAEIDRIIDHAVDAAKRYGSAAAAARTTKMESPFWDRLYQAALGAVEGK